MQLATWDRSQHGEQLLYKLSFSGFPIWLTCKSECVSVCQSYDWSVSFWHYVWSLPIGVWLSCWSLYADSSPVVCAFDTVVCFACASICVCVCVCLWVGKTSRKPQDSPTQHLQHLPPTCYAQCSAAGNSSSRTYVLPSYPIIRRLADTHIHS